MKKPFITSTLLICISSLIFTTVYAEDKKDAAAEQIVKSNTDFALDLYQQLKTKDGNLFFSPYSISTALAVMYAGADNETARQMVQTLRFPDYDKPEAPGWLNTEVQLHKAYRRIMEQINAQGQKGACELFIANALWGQEDYPFLNSFVELNNSYYLAELETVDFINSKEREKARTKINKWVEKKTKKNIKDFLSSGMLDSETRLVLINAIYFKGNWANQFKKSATQKQDFYLSSDGRVQAPLMFQKEDFRYAETDALKVLELPYKGEDLSMLVFLPKAKDGLPELEHELTSKNMAEWQRNLHKIEIEVYLPKFTFNSEFQLADTLSNMGMPAVFGPDADFSGITENDNLFISNVIHKALVEVNEKGTKAVAVTGLSGIMSALDPTPPPVFRADHPFVFLIKDNNTETILFLGRMSNPTKEY